MLKGSAGVAVTEKRKKTKNKTKNIQKKRSNQFLFHRCFINGKITFKYYFSLNVKSTTSLGLRLPTTISNCRSSIKKEHIQL